MLKRASWPTFSKKMHTFASAKNICCILQPSLLLGGNIEGTVLSAALYRDHLLQSHSSKLQANLVARAFLRSLCMTIQLQRFLRTKRYLPYTVPLNSACKIFCSKYVESRTCGPWTSSTGLARHFRTQSTTDPMHNVCISEKPFKLSERAQ